ncbi:MAG TPA: DUF3467 domain-containing protein [Candidatus Polarisedimenticolia bacterium]|nr:DUF3467 domain-containing protein [Candidatus Polarisedimenticolia bacterium]
MSQDDHSETPKPPVPSASPVAPVSSVPLKGRIDDRTAEGSYSNIASIMFNRSEFYIDFGRLVPGKQEVTVHSRIITSPAHAKDLTRLLLQNIQQYEERFGAIPGDPTDPRKVGF